MNYDDALELLKSADGEVKTAVVMSKLKIEIKDARKHLSEKQGSLRKTLNNSNII